MGGKYTDEAYEWYKKYYFDLYDGSNIEDDDDPSEEECEECDSFYDMEHRGTGYRILF